MADLNEEQIRKLVETALNQLGSQASSETVSKVVQAAVERIKPGEVPASIPRTPRQGTQSRIIITAFGKNRSGILAGLTGVLAEMQCDILDLSQKILQEFFTTMLLVDIANSSFSFEDIKAKITAVGEGLDLKVIIQHEEIFNAMHRV